MNKRTDSRQTGTSFQYTDESNSLMNSSSACSRKSGPARRAQGGWTAEDDEVLKRAVKFYGGKQWKKIAGYVGKFSESQCLHRWTKVVNPKVNKSPFTPQEDKILIDLVRKHGIGKWSLIAKHLGNGRIGKQCRERFLNQLSPSIKKGPWTEEEELVLITAQSVYGNKWTKIAELLPGRTDNAIKNHWNCNLKKKRSDQGVADEHIADSRPTNKSGFSGRESNTNTPNVSSLSVNGPQELNISETSTTKEIHWDLNQDPNSEHLEAVVDNSEKQPEASFMTPNSIPHSSNETLVATITPRDLLPTLYLASPISNFLKSTSGSSYHINTQISSSKVKSHSDTDLITSRRKRRRSDNVSCKENIVSISKSNVHEVSNEERVVLGNIEAKLNTSSVKDCTKISEYIATEGRQLDFTSVECENDNVGSPSSFGRMGTTNFS